MSWQALSWAAEQQTGSPHAKLLLLLLALLFVNLFFPFGLSIDPDLGDYVLGGALDVAKLLVVAGGFVVVEMLFAKMRFFELSWSRCVMPEASAPPSSSAITARP